MSEEKYCPFTHLPCKRECAWYDEDTQKCAVLLLAQSARKVSKNGR